MKPYMFWKRRTAHHPLPIIFPSPPGHKKRLFVGKQLKGPQYLSPSLALTVTPFLERHDLK